MSRSIKKQNAWWFVSGLILVISILAIGSCERKSALRQTQGGAAEAATTTYVAPGDLEHRRVGHARSVGAGGGRDGRPDQQNAVLLASRVLTVAPAECWWRSLTGDQRRP